MEKGFFYSGERTNRKCNGAKKGEIFCMCDTKANSTFSFHVICQVLCVYM